MAIISFSQNGLTPFQQLLGHNKNILEKWASLEESIFSSDTFPAELKEEVRRTLAFNNGCEYCKAKGVPSKTGLDARTQLAVHIADRSSKTIHISDDEFGILKKTFTDSEISELLALICFVTACQRFGALLDLAPSCQI
ncbi:carboxymuconolactone decarboxylase family protein [Caproiciproducens sp. NJN-50]|uniref:carboxymuconolactone decarboxylase family protein n=1 Tax=Acutalibacteraceae TaxID=3082771 RepID=UPI000FFE02E9|nr:MULTISPECIES: carboxymuconolactone decarboxylase family protein [Acutalibacteraceae]QAT49495.1 carboxymuconolactone decarboxylase family protein [Caproiciproducens sp. NJN-50]